MKKETEFGTLIDSSLSDFKKYSLGKELGYLMSLNNLLKLQYTELVNMLKDIEITLYGDEKKDLYTKCAGVMFKLEEKVLYLNQYIDTLLKDPKDR